LPTPYFHVVFTLPEEIATIAHQNKAVVYGTLFRAAAETLRTIAADLKHLGAELGVFARSRACTHLLRPAGRRLPDCDIARIYPARATLPCGSMTNLFATPESKAA